MDKMVQLFESRSLLENNASYAQVFTVIRCHLLIGIVIELTCPCKENMEVCHQQKFEKYEPLSTSIKSNGWPVYLFAIEVGARGYCSTTAKFCLLSLLGFSGKLLKQKLSSLVCLP